MRPVYEDEFLLVCDKPSGLMVEPDRNNFPNLLQQVKKYLSASTDALAYAQHIHRLDRPVCGLVLFAKQREALKPLSEMMAERRVQKFYRAYTAHAPEQKEASLLHWHRKEKKKACIVPEGTAYAERVQLDYRVSQRGRYFFWEIQLHTGKFHQIRAQLSHIGCPILGDTFYGSSLVLAEPAIALQAYRLVFQHPITGQAMDLHSRMELNTGNFPLD